MLHDLRMLDQYTTEALDTTFLFCIPTAGLFFLKKPVGMNLFSEVLAHESLSLQNYTEETSARATPSDPEDELSSDHTFIIVQQIQIHFCLSFVPIFPFYQISTKSCFFAHSSFQ